MESRSKNTKVRLWGIMEDVARGNDQELIDADTDLS
jgi:hypothetical protein